MTVLASLIFTTFTSYIVMPLWFDHGFYSHSSTHSTLEECQIAERGLDAICVGDSPVHLYINNDTEVVEESKEMTQFVQCDYWAGCFNQ
jgi:hypothetical protein